MWYGIPSWKILDMLYDLQVLKPGANPIYPLDLINTTEDATQTDLAGEQSNNGRVEAVQKDERSSDK